MEGLIPVNAFLTKGLDNLPAETLIEVMTSMSSPTNLLNFLLAFPLTHTLFRRFHREILSRVLDAKAPDNIKVQRAKDPPLSYHIAVRILGLPGPPMPLPLNVPRLRNPMGTLVAVVLTMANISDVDRKRYRKLMRESDDRGPDRWLPQMLRAYWTTRCTLKESRAVVSQCPSFPYTLRRKCPLLAFEKTKRSSTAFLVYRSSVLSKDRLADRCITGRTWATTCSNNVHGTECSGREEDSRQSMVYVAAAGRNSSRPVLTQVWYIRDMVFTTN